MCPVNEMRTMEKVAKLELRLDFINLNLHEKSVVFLLEKTRSVVFGTLVLDEDAVVGHCDAIIGET